MQKTFIFCLVLLFISITTNAQRDFRSGYIILSSGDTLRGEIDFARDARMSQSCLFRIDKNVAPRNYSPDEIKAYRLDDGRYFISENIPGRGRIFLEYLVDGKLNIYHDADLRNEYYYVRKEGDSIRELKKGGRIKEVDGVQYKLPPLEAQGLLSALTNDAPQFQSRIRNIKSLDQRYLVSLAVDYHNAVCNDQKCMVFEKTLPPVRISVQPYFGYSIYFPVSKVAYEYGGFVHISLPLQNERMYVKTGLVRGDIPLDFIYSGKYYKVPFHIRYLAPGKELRPELSFGPDLYFINGVGENYMEFTFNAMAALNINLYKNKLYLTVGADLNSLPVGEIFDNRGTNLFYSSTVFSGLYFTF